eukprot:PhM_4_TR13640/c0_g1_i2/m.67553
MGCAASVASSPRTSNKNGKGAKVSSSTASPNGSPLLREKANRYKLQSTSTSSSNEVGNDGNNVGDLHRVAQQHPSNFNEEAELFQSGRRRDDDDDVVKITANNKNTTLLPSDGLTTPNDVYNNHHDDDDVDNDGQLHNVALNNRHRRKPHHHSKPFFFRTQIAPWRRISPPPLTVLHCQLRHRHRRNEWLRQNNFGLSDGLLPFTHRRRRIVAMEMNPLLRIASPKAPPPRNPRPQQPARPLHCLTCRSVRTMPLSQSSGAHPLTLDEIAPILEHPAPVVVVVAPVVR